MTVMVREPRSPQKFLLEDFLALDTPEGYRAELIDGEIVVTPPPAGGHEYIIGRIVRQIFQRSPVDLDYAPYKGIVLPVGPSGATNHVIPDGTFALSELDVIRGAGSWMPADGVLLVVEVTSSKPERDREDKRLGYAAAAIPFYLLVDRERRQVSLFHGPDDGDYRELVRTPFGKSLALPEPFKFDLDTAAFD